jgi:ribonuclease Z
MQKFTVGGVLVIGYSLAGEETVVGLPELNICFDVGRAPREIIPIDNVCLSHGHMDHAAGVAYYLSQRGFIGAPPGRVIVHRDQARNIQRLMDVWRDIEGHYAPGEIEGVLAGDEVAIRRNLVVRVFDVVHGALALGFAIVERRHKLKSEFIGLTGPEIVALKKKGVEIQQETEISLAAYCGDTSTGPFLDLPHVRDAELLIIECTFFDHDHLRRARQGNHIHISDLRDVMDRVNAKHVLLTHVTRRTDIRQAKSMIRDAVEPDDLERLSFLMERRPRAERQNPKRQTSVANPTSQQ